MVDEPSYEPLRLFRSRRQSSISRFKMTILSLLIQQADLLDLPGVEDSDIAIDKLNKLLQVYAGCTISKFRLMRETSKMEFRVAPKGAGNSFPFDGLSSGQKEIVSTLFLIWHYTQERPAVVLIDEPELHLNAQWHGKFVNSLFDLAAHNQYIVATHSVDVMASIEKDRRLLLEEG